MALSQIKQGRINGNPVADGWAGAEVRNHSKFKNVKELTDGRTDGRTDRPTRQGVESRVRD